LVKILARGENEKMGFLNDVGKKTADTTSKIAKEAKLKLKTNENKSKISDLYEEIGKIVYEKYVREEGINIKEELREECEKIDFLAIEIEKARMEILKLNQKRQCRKCNCEIQNNYVFCPRCGKKQIEEENTCFDEALEKLEETEITPKNKKKEKIVKEKLEKLEKEE